MRAADVAPGDVLVVCQKGLEEALRAGPLPGTVDVRHFNDVGGENAWERVALVVVIGRTQPAPRTVERNARVVFGTEVQEIASDEEGEIRYPQTTRGIRLRDGRGVAIKASYHPDPRVEEVRWAICEAGLVQSIGRGRGVNRTTTNALQIDIITNVVLPIEVDEVTTWDRIQPGAAQIMHAAGAVPLSYADMATSYPDLFPTAEAARMTLTREAKNPEQTPIGEPGGGGNPKQTPISYISIGVCSGFPRQRYRRRGARGPAVVLLYDPARIEPKSWLTEHIGEVALLAPEVEEVQPDEPGEHSPRAERSFVEHRILDASGRPHDPVRAGVIRCDFGIPATAEVSQFFPVRLWRAQIDAAPELMFTLPSGRVLWLASINGSVRQVSDPAQESVPDWLTTDVPGEGLAAVVHPPSMPSFYAVVDEVTSGGYPSEEDWLEATRRWIERCRLRPSA